MKNRGVGTMKNQLFVEIGRRALTIGMILACVSPAAANKALKNRHQNMSGRLKQFVQKKLPLPYRVTVVEKASGDLVRDGLRFLAAREVVSLPSKGRRVAELEQAVSKLGTRGLHGGVARLSLAFARNPDLAHTADQLIGHGVFGQIQTYVRRGLTPRIAVPAMAKLASALKSGNRTRNADARVIINGVRQLVKTIQHDLVGDWSQRALRKSYAYETMESDLNRLFESANLGRLP